ncbi:hypothetical protein RIF29_22021 [Crotalaria pallida]|uniref:Uncharacterized protein n=1 Tax=Crotalaria pallida TaxID=3830 RepID=A0AAN9FCJ8_CROPI
MVALLSDSKCHFLCMPIKAAPKLTTLGARKRKIDASSSPRRVNWPRSIEQRLDHILRSLNHIKHKLAAVTQMIQTVMQSPSGRKWVRDLGERMHADDNFFFSLEQLRRPLARRQVNQPRNIAEELDEIERSLRHMRHDVETMHRFMQTKVHDLREKTQERSTGSVVLDADEEVRIGVDDGPLPNEDEDEDEDEDDEDEDEDDEDDEEDEDEDEEDRDGSEDDV